MAIGYKVVNVLRGNGYPDIYCSYNQTVNNNIDYIEYKLGETIHAPNNTRLFIFKELHDCRQCYYPDSVFVFRKIFKCEYFGGIEYNGACEIVDYKNYWKWFNETLAKKKGFKNAYCPYETHNYIGVLLVKKIKVLEEVSNKEYLEAVNKLYRML